jgi:hypothetical protein
VARIQEVLALVRRKYWSASLIQLIGQCAGAGGQITGDGAVLSGYPNARM